MKKLRAGVIGVGHLGKEHARIYHGLPEVELVTLCDLDETKAERADALGVKFTPNFRKLFGAVDLVSIATPTATHFQIAREVLEAGIHTLIEKPIANRLEEADELIEIAKRRNLTLKVGHLERYNAGFKRVEQIAKNIRFLEIHRLGPFSPRIADCGVVLDLMIHDLDIMLQLVKSEIESIDAIGINVLTSFEDIANVRIKFRNKTIANLTASRLTPEAQRKIRIFQEDAYISLDYVAQSAQIFRKASFPQALFGGKISREQIDIQKEEPLKAELQDFVRSVGSGSLNGKPDVAAREALKVALLVLESIRENTPQPLHAQ
ncbi:MAG TPA: Gfo/Idh/MocA family oxidoreductase [Candidatus Omnitrophota bacterium]|nr:Gfo/Idh/MocA family oxidoreductase [Candidatus Omnitrophota bacterium]